MAPQNSGSVRVKQGAVGEPYESLSKILGFRWYLNRIENLFFSIYAEHPCESSQNDPQYRDPAFADVHAGVWDILRNCERQMIELKKQFAPPKPPASSARDCGCWDDNDCFDDWVCRDGFCRPRPPDDGRLAG